MHKEVKQMAVEELANDICKGCKSRFVCRNESCCAMSEIVAEALYNAGYRKTVWHKVADGDLPNEDEEVCCYTIDDEYTNGKLVPSIMANQKWDLQNNASFYNTVDYVIAWTELPTHKGEK